MSLSGEGDRDPFIYLLPGSGGSCDTRACDHASDQCTGTGDEHFAFVAPSDGIWYLGIDDHGTGGGLYQLTAINPLCGDGSTDHGESCDGESTCDNRCHEILSESRPAEQAPNDNEVEANVLDFPASGVLQLTGNIGGGTCTYPDVFQFSVPAGGQNLNVQFFETDGTTVCSNNTLTPFDAVLRTLTGDVRAGPSTNGTTGCSELNVSGLEEGSYNLYLEHSTPISGVNYRLQVTLSN